MIRLFLLLNFFQKLWDGIAALGAAIWEVFSSIAEAVTSLALMPLVSLLGALCNAIINAILTFMARIAQGILSLFAIDIGSGNSTFEIVIGEMDWAIGIMQALGIVLLFFIVTTNLIRIMTDAKGATESPGRLMATTLAAGCFIFLGADIIVFAQRIFNVAYSKVLSLGNFDNLDFSGFATTVQEHITGDSFSLNLGKQLGALSATLFVLFIIVLIFVMFVKYMLEVSQRYVVLGMLIVTSPAAISLAAAKSTRTSFTRWVRMIACQLILMLMSVVFLTAFFASLNNFSNAISSFPGAGGSGGGMTAVVTWGILMYTLLYAGTRVDSYLKSLGLSVAETGTDMMSSLMADLMDMGAVFSGLGERSSRTRGERTSSQNTFTRGAARLGNRQAHTPEKTLQRNISTGIYMASSINETVKNMTKGAVAKPDALGTSVLSHLRGLPSRVAEKFDPKTCTIQKGCIKMSTVPNRNGEKMEVAFVPKDIAEKQGIPTNYGRAVTLGTEKYIAVPYGRDKRSIQHFLTSNPSGTKQMFAKHGDNVTPILNKQGKQTGGYRLFNQRECPSNLPQGYSAVSVCEWVPASNHQPDAALNAKMERIGTMDYWRYEIPLVRNEDGKMSCLCTIPSVPPGAADKSMWLHEQFPSVASEGFSVRSQDGSGVITLQKGESTYQMAPTALYCVSKDSLAQENFLAATAANGTLYTIAKEPHDSHGESLFEEREDVLLDAFAQRTHFSADAFSNFLPSDSGIASEGQRRSKKRKR